MTSAVVQLTGNDGADDPSLPGLWRDVLKSVDHTTPSVLHLFCLQWAVWLANGRLETIQELKVRRCRLLWMSGISEIYKIPIVSADLGNYFNIHICICFCFSQVFLISLLVSWSFQCLHTFISADGSFSSQLMSNWDLRCLHCCWSGVISNWTVVCCLVRRTCLLFPTHHLLASWIQEKRTWTHLYWWWTQEGSLNCCRFVLALLEVRNMTSPVYNTALSLASGCVNPSALCLLMPGLLELFVTHKFLFCSELYLFQWK